MLAILNAGTNILFAMECKAQDLVVNYFYRNMLNYIINSAQSLNLSDLRISGSGHIQQPLVDKIGSNYIPPNFPHGVNNQISEKRDGVNLITFTNGNTYTGTMRDDVMNGEGLFRWTDGCTYRGHFSANQMTGLGRIDWPDQSWYEGGVVGGARHGHGAFVGARDGRAYLGQWRSGAKHGSGVIRYSWRRTHDGMWYKNVRDGYGIAEYGPHCVYQGEWKNDQQDGHGEMIWPNNDYYTGEWKNGKMDGKNGHYIWNTFYNTSMSISLANNYQGDWKAGRRHGQGHLEFGFTNGTYYDGNFNMDKKDGIGTLIKGNGELLFDDNLFQNDHQNSLTLHKPDTKEVEALENNNLRLSCAGGVNLNYHVMNLFNNVDQLQANEEQDSREEAVNRTIMLRGSSDETFMKEKEYLQMALNYYESCLKMVYHKYASNKEELYFTTVLSRLYLWQLYMDIGVREKGIYLTDIDKMMQKNPSSRSKNPHNPFEPVYYSQYLHSMLDVARKLYANDSSLGVEPTTVLRCAFTKFMREDVLPNIDTSEGFCSNDLPLAAVYELYRSVGEPHTIQDFLRSVHRPYSGLNVRPSRRPQPDFEIFEGKNIMAAGHGPIYEVDKSILVNNRASVDCQRNDDETKLFNIDNLPCRKLLNILSNVEPGVSESGLVVNVNLHLTFIEFFEALFVCLKESIRAEKEQLLRQEQVASNEAKVNFKKEKFKSRF